MNIGIFLGILAGVTVTTIYNEKMKKEYQEQQKRKVFEKKIELEPAKEKIQKVKKQKIKEKE